MSSSGSNIDFMAGGGEMGALTRAYDWNSSPLGPPEKWPQSLRVTVRLMLNTRHPLFIWWGPELIQFYNDAYAETMGPERHPSALGARGRECWDEIWHIIGPQIDYVMAGKGSTWDEDRLVPVTRHGKLENVWWTYSYGPIDVPGGVGGVLVICNDVTEQHLIKEALKNETQRLERLFEQAPGFMAVVRGPDHVFELGNAAYRRLIGDREFLGRCVRDALPELEGQGFFELLDSVYRSGETHVGRRTPIRVQSVTGGALRELFLDFVYQPIVEANGAISGVFVEGVDVSDHVQAEEHLHLMNKELIHRVKNTLSMVSAIATQTFRERQTGRDTELLAFQGRLAAFAKAHDTLTATTWATASIREVVKDALEPHKIPKERISVSGPEIILGSKQALSLSLAIHELATNATKYGALSSASGKVVISWQQDVDSGGPTFRFLWEESGGPKVVIPTKKGFGTQLITRALRADFGGSVRFEYAPNGVVCRLFGPMENLRPENSPPF